MKVLTRKIFLAVFFCAFFTVNAQDSLQQKSNIQQYTPSKLVGKGQYDVSGSIIYILKPKVHLQKVQSQDKLFSPLH